MAVPPTAQPNRRGPTAGPAEAGRRRLLLPPAPAGPRTCTVVHTAVCFTRRVFRSGKARRGSVVAIGRAAKGRPAWGVLTSAEARPPARTPADSGRADCALAPSTNHISR